MALFTKLLLGISSQLRMSRQPCLKTVLWLTLGLMLLSHYGCVSYMSSHEAGYCCEQTNPATNPATNPNFLFATAAASQAYHPGVAANRTDRPAWPRARIPQGYVDTGEITTYREYSYSDQYITNDNRPRVHFHRRATIHRQVHTYR